MIRDTQKKGRSPLPAGTVESPTRTWNDHPRWLVLFYSVPAHPVNNRMRIWRKLSRSGAVKARESVYLLPDSEEHYEFFQWIVAEVSGMGGEAAFIRAPRIETMPDNEIMDLFNRQRAHDYGAIEKEISELERRLAVIRKGGKPAKQNLLLGQFSRIRKSSDDVLAIDFFGSPSGKALGRRIKELDAELLTLPDSSHASMQHPTDIEPVSISDFQEKTWVTRRSPFVDRMASAWLIRKFIDPRAVFSFLPDDEHRKTPQGCVLFDVRDGRFTHRGDLCTFEVLMRSFGLKGPALKKVAEIVHELDVKDSRYAADEARGIERVLTGIRRTAADDADALERGIGVFEMLHVSLGGS